MTSYYHMSAKRLCVADIIRGNGRDKIDQRIENELEARRPPFALSRRDAVFARPSTDFSLCGILSDGYIYSVAPEGAPQRYDLNWIGPMQLALLKEKHGAAHPSFNRHPDWSPDLIGRCCPGYWSGTASSSPVWECLAPAATVIAILSDRPVSVTETRGGWPPASP